MGERLAGGRTWRGDCFLQIVLRAPAVGSDVVVNIVPVVAIGEGWTGNNSAVRIFALNSQNVVVTGRNQRRRTDIDVDSSDDSVVDGEFGGGEGGGR